MKPFFLPAFIALALILIVVSPIPGQDAPDKSVVLVFQNTTTHPVDVYWVKVAEGQDDQEMLHFETLPPNHQQQ